MTETKKLSKYYSDIFKVYLNFSPEYRRNLIDLNDMFKWIEEIEIRDISHKYDFFVLMEWFNAFNLIKPFCIIQYPPEMFNEAQFIIRSGSENLRELFEKGVISFPTEIYDIKISNEEDIRSIKPWKYQKIQANKDVQENLRSYFQYDLIQYVYHPLQFFQVLTYLKGYSYRQLFSIKQYSEFYWRRRFQFDDYLIEKIKNSIKEEKKSVDDFIKEEISNTRGLHQLDFIFFGQNQWLIPRSLLMWVKIETLYRPVFFRPSRSHDVSINFQIPLEEQLNEKRFEEFLKRHNNWIKKITENLTDYFKKEDYYHIKELRQETERYLHLYGLENFVDLFLLIHSNKKNKLKGYLSYYVNILEIIRTLRKFEGFLIEKIPELEKEKKEPKWYEPKFYFESEEEKIEYIQKLYLEYGLTQKDTYVVFVEGPSEKILLEDWTRIIHSRTHVKLDIQELDGKSNAKFFKYMINKFSANEYFLILDADTDSYIAGKKEELKNAKISEDSYHIFYPDFITANFNQDEIFRAFLEYFEEISEKIKEKKGEEIVLKKTDKKEFLEILKDKEVGDKYENLVEKYLKIKLNNEEFELKKTLFARKLKNNIVLEGKNRKRYPFEEILGKFATKIQMKTFPEEIKKDIIKNQIKKSG